MVQLPTGSWKETRQTEKEVGRQHQGMDRSGVRQVPEGSDEQRKMEETGYGVNCGAPTTPAVEGWAKKGRNKLSESVRMMACVWSARCVQAHSFLVLTGLQAH